MFVRSDDMELFGQHFQGKLNLIVLPNRVGRRDVQVVDSSCGRCAHEFARLAVEAQAVGQGVICNSPLDGRDHVGGSQLRVIGGLCEGWWKRLCFDKSGANRQVEAVLVGVAARVGGAQFQRLTFRWCSWRAVKSARIPVQRQPAW